MCFTILYLNERIVTSAVSLVSVLVGEHLGMMNLIFAKVSFGSWICLEVYGGKRKRCEEAK